jgi:hypothetical protein
VLSNSQIMAKSGQGWRDDLNDQICWRFSNYTYVVKYTISRFERDLLYLKPYYEKSPRSEAAMAHNHLSTNQPPIDAALGPDQRAHTFPLSGVEKMSATEVVFSPLVDKSWSFPFGAGGVESMCRWIEKINKDLRSMNISLEEVTAMAFSLLLYC